MFENKIQIILKTLINSMKRFLLFFILIFSIQQMDAKAELVSFKNSINLKPSKKQSVKEDLNDLLKRLKEVEKTNDYEQIMRLNYRVGLAYYKLKRYKRALYYLETAGQIAEDNETPERLLQLYTKLSETSRRAGKTKLAVYYKTKRNELQNKILTEKSKALAEQKRKAEEEQAELKLKLSQAKNISQEQKNQLDTIEKELTGLQDELENVATEKEILEQDNATLENDNILLENEKQQAELELAYKSKINNYLIFGLIVFLLLMFAIFYLYRLTHKEKARSEALLLNILPKHTANELKTKGKVAAQSLEKVTVCFIDFKGFTKISERLNPQELVNELDFHFKKFDEIFANYNVEKIKTIGDAYMCAGGLHTDSAQANAVINAALEIRDYMNEIKAEKENLNLPFFEARIGIHTGPVVAGVVGIHKFAYDIWGDTVNTAARMESSGEVAKVNVSENTYQILQNENDFVFEPRGKIAAKGKGEIKMYFVENKLSNEPVLV